jgi:hypothetical protein
MGRSRRLGRADRLGRLGRMHRPGRLTGRRLLDGLVRLDGPFGLRSAGRLGGGVGLGNVSRAAWRCLPSCTHRADSKE